MRTRRHGFTMTELAVAAALLSATLLFAVQTIAAVGRQQRMVQTHLLVMQEMSNAMEQLMAMPYDQVTSQSMESIQLSSQARAVLHEGTLRGEVESVTAGRAKKITLTIAWSNRVGQRQSRPPLVAWRYAAQEQPE